MSLGQARATLDRLLCKGASYEMLHTILNIALGQRNDFCADSFVFVFFCVWFLCGCPEKQYVSTADTDQEYIMYEVDAADVIWLRKHDAGEHLCV